MALATLVYVILSNRSKANADKLSSLDDRVTLINATLGHRIDVAEDKVIRIETNLEHLPDKDATHRMELAIRDLRAEVGVLGERMKPVAAISVRLQEFLLERESR